MSRPAKGSATRQWRYPEVANLWHALVQSALESDGQLAILASCRFANPDLHPYILPLRPLARDAVWSLFTQLPALRHIAPENRHRLVQRVVEAYGSESPRGADAPDESESASLV